MTHDYDVAFSFAGEQRPYVEQVAHLLRQQGIRVFYDLYEQADLWGRNLADHLDEVYRRKARYCVLFASADYERKAWTTHERRSAQARAFEQSSEYVLPVRFDDTQIPGVLPTVGFIDLRTTTEEQLAALIARKLGQTPVEPHRFTEALEVHRQKRRDHEMGYARPGKRLGDDEAKRFITEHAARADAILRNLVAVLNAPEHDGHFAQRLSETYEAMLDWAAEVRGTQSSYRELFEIAGRFLDQPIRQVEEFVAAYVEAEKAGEPVRLNLEITVDEETLRRYDEEARRVVQTR